MRPVFYPLLQQNPTHGGLSLSGYMALLIAAIMLPMLVLVAILARDYAAAARRTIEAERLDVASNIRILIDREIEQTAGFLDGISTAPGLRSGDTALIEKIAAVARERGYQSLAVWSLDGERLLVSSSLRQPVKAEEVGLSEIKAGRKVFVSNLVKDAGTPQGLYFVSVPIVEKGSVVAMMTAGLWPARLQRILYEAGLREGWAAGIVDRNGILLARSRLAERYVGLEAQAPMVEAARSDRDQGLFDVVSRDGLAMKNAFERSPGSGWVAAVAVPAVIVEAPLWHTAAIMTAIGAGLTLVALVLALMVAGYLSRAIRRLGLAAAAIAGGDAVRMPITHIAELRDVSRSMERTGEAARQDRRRRS
jgi:hypothetical protein